MLWIRKDITTEQVLVDFLDITVVLLSLLEHEVLLFSVYILCQDTEALGKAVNYIR
jgi:hypothetical protein